MTLHPPIPVLRIFDAALARQFYLDWLGFRLDWEARTGPDGPRYLQVSRGPVVLHLTEHYGDCSRGAKVFINTDDVEALHRELATRPNLNRRPGVDLAPWNAKIMELIPTQREIAAECPRHRLQRAGAGRGAHSKREGRPPVSTG